MESDPLHEILKHVDALYAYLREHSPWKLHSIVDTAVVSER